MGQISVEKSALDGSDLTGNQQAHAVIGGLISSTVLTLVVVPVLLTYLDALGGRMKSLVVGPPTKATTKSAVREI